ncbi:hypothetical protein M422DRAFT_256423 [Sphaerobolus stellatus SS14]|uniref:Uncharacterized protein n=1 Tax=Sphaerobolus stellatus (strain SS14) TaxID=990650 RepID=A0A0C9VRU8_SPHS4|nr:hypothetical protein M422DRAFT_256423 [Sphaerobolus stellatus SS14]
MEFELKIYILCWEVVTGSAPTPKRESSGFVWAYSTSVVLAGEDDLARCAFFTAWKVSRNSSYTSNMYYKSSTSWIGTCVPSKARIDVAVPYLCRSRISITSSHHLSLSIHLGPSKDLTRAAAFKWSPRSMCSPDRQRNSASRIPRLRLISITSQVESEDQARVRVVESATSRILLGDENTSSGAFLQLETRVNLVDGHTSCTLASRFSRGVHWILATARLSIVKDGMLSRRRVYQRTLLIYLDSTHLLTVKYLNRFGKVHWLINNTAFELVGVSEALKARGYINISGRNEVVPIPFARCAASSSTEPPHGIDICS